MNIKRIACYLRRSRQDVEREKRTGEDTLATQKRIMLEALDRLQIPYDVFEEIGSGDKIETRPVFQKVLEDLRQKNYDAVAVKEIPRLGRGAYSDMGQIYDLIIQQNIFIVTPYKTYDPSNPADLRHIRFELFFAREEFEMIKERLVGAKYTQAAAGRWMGGVAPYGYQLNQKTLHLEPVEQEAQVVNLIFDLYVNGLETDEGKKEMGFQAIATYLTRLGIPTPRKAKSWSHITVQRIIENEVYKGMVKYRVSRRVGNKYIERPENQWIVVEDAHEPLVDSETWEMAQKKRNSFRQPAVKLDFSPCELAGIVICGKCGKRMVRQFSLQTYHRKDGGVSQYQKEFLWCPTPGCTCVKYRDVEAGILRYLETLGSFDVQKLQELFSKEYTKQKEEVASTLDTDILIEKKRSELIRRLNFVCEKFETGVYDEQTFLTRKQELEKELEFLDSIGQQTGQHEPDDEKVMVHLRDNIKTFLQAYQEATNKTAKNRLLRELVSHVIVTKTGRGQFDLDIYPRFRF